VYEVLLFVGGSILGLELWRRSLVRDQKIPRWASIASIVGFVIAAAAGGLTVWMLDRAQSAATAEASAEKTTLLARSISHALNANAVAVATTGAVGILLLVFAIKRRR
jgi:hypothetical protein